MAKKIRDFNDLLVAKKLHNDAIKLLNKHLEDSRLSDVDREIIQERIKKHKKKLKKANREIEKLHKQLQKAISKLNNKASKMYDKTKVLCINTLDNSNEKDTKENKIKDGIDKKESSLPNSSENQGSKKVSKHRTSANSNKEKTKRLSLGKNVEYVDAIEFSDCTFNDVIELRKEHIKFPFEARVIFNGNIQGYIEVVSDKISIVKKGSIIRRYRDGSVSKRLIDKFDTCIEYELIEKVPEVKYAAYDVLDDIQFTSLLDAIMFITGGNYGLDNGITVERYYKNQGEDTNE
ncbi:MAG: hypothetical protein J6A59_11035 [Lachnospiraceae bacterium]|nr:hypothetical protein [Lachnospiraceae bacterium]